MCFHFHFYTSVTLEKSRKIITIEFLRSLIFGDYTDLNTIGGLLTTKTNY